MSQVVWQRLGRVVIAVQIVGIRRDGGVVARVEGRGNGLETQVAAACVEELRIDVQHVIAGRAGWAVTAQDAVGHRHSRAGVEDVGSHTCCVAP